MAKLAECIHNSPTCTHRLAIQRYAPRIRKRLHIIGSQPPWPQCAVAQQIHLANPAPSAQLMNPNAQIVRQPAGAHTTRAHVVGSPNISVASVKRAGRRRNSNTHTMSRFVHRIGAHRMWPNHYGAGGVPRVSSGHMQRYVRSARPRRHGLGVRIAAVHSQHRSQGTGAKSAERLRALPKALGNSPGWDCGLDSQFQLKQSLRPKCLSPARVAAALRDSRLAEPCAARFAAMAARGLGIVC